MHLKGVEPRLSNKHYAVGYSKETQCVVAIFTVYMQ